MNAPQPDGERFLRSYAGYFLTDLIVLDEETRSGVSLYICRDCHALTPEPLLHDAWHEGLTTTQISVSTPEAVGGSTARAARHTTH